MSFVHDSRSYTIDNSISRRCPSRRTAPTGHTYIIASSSSTAPLQAKPPEHPRRRVCVSCLKVKQAQAAQIPVRAWEQVQAPSPTGALCQTPVYPRTQRSPPRLVPLPFLARQDKQGQANLCCSPGLATSRTTTAPGPRGLPSPSSSPSAMRCCPEYGHVGRTDC